MSRRHAARPCNVLDDALRTALTTLAIALP
jgi:hypothetical protein